MAAPVLFPLPQACRAAMFFALLIALCSLSLHTLQFHTPPHRASSSTSTSSRLQVQVLSAVVRAKNLALMMLRRAAYGAAVTELALRLLPCGLARRVTAAAGLAMAAASLGWAVKITGAVVAAVGTRSTGGAAYYCYYLGLVAVRAVACAGLVHALLGVFWGADQPAALLVSDY